VRASAGSGCTGRSQAVNTGCSTRGCTVSGTTTACAPLLSASSVYDVSICLCGIRVAACEHMFACCHQSQASLATAQYRTPYPGLSVVNTVIPFVLQSAAVQLLLAPEPPPHEITLAIATDSSACEYVCAVDQMAWQSSKKTCVPEDIDNCAFGSGQPATVSSLCCLLTLTLYLGFVPWPLQISLLRARVRAKVTLLTQTHSSQPRDLAWAPWCPGL
jgi:hypothetical protein